MWRRVCILLLPLCLLALLPVRGQAQDGPNRAGLVVQYGDGSVTTICVSFAEDQITGLELLARSGLPYIVQQAGIGAAVCKIGNDGCNYPAEDCFCKRDGTRSIYWAYQTLVEGSWRYSNLGVSNTRVRNGDVQGWAWGVGDTNQGTLPPLYTFAQICESATLSQSPTEVPPTEAPPTEVPPTAAPPTAVPPTQPPATVAAPTQPPATSMPATVAPATSVPPTALPPSPVSTTLPTLVQSPTRAASTATIASTTSSAAAMATDGAATPTGQAAGVAAAPTVSGDAANRVAADGQGGNLLAFALLALVLLAGIGFIIWRRRGQA